MNELQLKEHTPGPWYWVLNPASKTLELESAHGWRTTVFRCVRWGTQSAKLQFNSGNIMEDVEAFSRPIPGREHHRSWALDIDHPDAKLIASAPEILAALRKTHAYLCYNLEGYRDSEQYKVNCEVIDRFTQHAF